MMIYEEYIISKKADNPLLFKRMKIAIPQAANLDAEETIETMLRIGEFLKEYNLTFDDVLIEYIGTTRTHHDILVMWMH